MNQLINYRDMKGNINSIAKILFIFYVLALTGGSPLVSNQLNDFISGSRMTQHLLSLVTVIILITITGNSIDSRSAIIYGVLVYVWFIISTKMDLHWNIIMLILLFMCYMYENEFNVVNNKLINDSSIDDEYRVNIYNTQQQKRNMCIYALLIITIIGTLFYSKKKTEQYGGGYDIFKYYLG